MTNYVLGFMFDENEYGVLLIQKNKPEWQAGKLNGIGGKIEKDELPIQAMNREFKEETGIVQNIWQNFITIGDSNWKVWVYTCKTNNIHAFKTMEDETVLYIPLTELKDFAIISNLDWLIPMAIDYLNKNIDYKISNNNT